MLKLRRWMCKFKEAKDWTRITVSIVQRQKKKVRTVMCLLVGMLKNLGWVSVALFQFQRLRQGHHRPYPREPGRHHQSAAHHLQTRGQRVRGCFQGHGCGGQILCQGQAREICFQCEFFELLVCFCFVFYEVCCQRWLLRIDFIIAVLPAISVLPVIGLMGLERSPDLLFGTFFFLEKPLCIYSTHVFPAFNINVRVAMFMSLKDLSVGASCDVCSACVHVCLTVIILCDYVYFCDVMV